MATEEANTANTTNYHHAAEIVAKTILTHSADEVHNDELHEELYDNVDIDVVEEIKNVQKMISINHDEIDNNHNIDHHAFETEAHDADDGWDSIINHDYEPPCPAISSSCPYFVIILCCCCWSKHDRAQCALNLIYSRMYLLLYLLTILITIALLIYDLSNGSIANSTVDKEPIWFIILDIFCVALMVFDIIIQIQANKDGFFKSILNWIDFFIVIACVVSCSIYWIEPDFILEIVLLSRFILRLLRVCTIVRHQKDRKAYIDARDSIVDFTKFDQQKINESNQTDEF